MCLQIFLAMCLVGYLVYMAVGLPIAGPFDVVFLKGGRCPGNLGGRNAYYFEDRIVKHSRSYTYLLVNASLTIPLTDDMTSQLRLSVKSSQGWKDNYFTLNSGPPCKGAKTYLPSMFNEITRSIGINSCPLPMGNYTNVKISLSNATIAGLKVLFYNEYRVRVFVKLKDEIVTCLEVYVNVIPKKT